MALALAMALACAPLAVRRRGSPRGGGGSGARSSSLSISRRVHVAFCFVLGQRQKQHCAPVTLTSAVFGRSSHQSSPSPTKTLWQSLSLLGARSSIAPELKWAPTTLEVHIHTYVLTYTLR